MALCLIERASQKYVSPQSDENKASYMLHILKSEDNHLTSKALNILGSLSSQWNVATYLYKTNITRIIKNLLEKNDPVITKETAYLCA